MTLWMQISSGSETPIYLQLVEQISSAIAKGELSLAWQPQYALGEEKLIGVEALLRWNHPELGDLPPARFIPVAEAMLSLGLV